jgi:adenylate cyclase class 2
MVKEIEAKFLEVNIKELRKNIKDIGGKLIHPLMLYKRYGFFLINKNKKGYARVRQENGKVTMTIKTYDESKYANEYEVELNSSLEEAKEFMINAGFKLKAYHETLREKWKVEGCSEIVIDTIPGIPTYVELECNNEENIKKLAQKLNLDYSKAEYGGFDKQFVYYYGLTTKQINDKVPALTFKNIIEEIKPYIKKNKDLLKNVVKEQSILFDKAKKI